MCLLLQYNLSQQTSELLGKSEITIIISSGHEHENGKDLRTVRSYMPACLQY